MPDAKTIWLFRERLVRGGAIKALFARFETMLREAGYMPMAGQLVDASLVAAPKQRNTEAEKAAMKSAVRAKVEHVFGHQKDRMKLFIRTVGLARAEAMIGMANLVYNMKRLIWLNSRKPAPA